MVRRVLAEAVLSRQGGIKKGYVGEPIQAVEEWLGQKDTAKRLSRGDEMSSSDRKEADPHILEGESRLADATRFGEPHKLRPGADEE